MIGPTGGTMTKKQPTAPECIADLMANRYSLTAISAMLESSEGASSVPLLSRIKTGHHIASQKTAAALFKLAKLHGLSSLRRRA
jgi:hypothetical protein